MNPNFLGKYYYYSGWILLPQIEKQEHAYNSCTNSPKWTSSYTDIEKDKKHFQT